jgi:hypothetical protein
MKLDPHEFLKEFFTCNEYEVNDFYQFLNGKLKECILLEQELDKLQIVYNMRMCNKKCDGEKVDMGGDWEIDCEVYHNSINYLTQYVCSSGIWQYSFNISLNDLEITKRHVTVILKGCEEWDEYDVDEEEKKKVKREKNVKRS